MYGGIAEPGMGAYPPRVRRDCGVSPRGNSRRARLAPSLAKGERGGAPRPMGLGRGKRWDESHLPIILITRYMIIVRRPTGKQKTKQAFSFLGVETHTRLWLLT